MASTLIIPSRRVSIASSSHISTKADFNSGSFSDEYCGSEEPPSPHDADLPGFGFPTGLAPQELPVWDGLKKLKKRLRATRDEGEVTADGVVRMWEELVGHVKQLQKVRSSESMPSTLPPIRALQSDQKLELTGSNEDGPNDQNSKITTAAAADHLDNLLESLYPLFFLLWDTILWAATSDPMQSAPLTTASKSVSRAYRQLQGWQDTGIYSRAELEVLAERVGTDRAILKQIRSVANQLDADENCGLDADMRKRLKRSVKQGVALVVERADECDSILPNLAFIVDSIHSALVPVHERLVQISRELDALGRSNDPGSWDLAEIGALQEELRSIDSVRIDGKYIDLNGVIIPGQAVVVELLEQCFNDAHDLLERRDVVEGVNPLREVYEALIRIRGRLDSLLLTHRWSLNGEEVLAIQEELRSIDNLRVDGKFLDPEQPNIVPPGQAVLHGLLHKCYRLVHRLTEHLETLQTNSSSQSSDPADQLVRNQVVTLRKCLGELKKWKVRMTGREVVPYQLKLKELDGMRRRGDGSSGDMDEDVALMIRECYEIIGELKIEEPSQSHGSE
ncbi:hypothetical protein HDU93_006059 [Gonapodya sp. JEL0774]|nr:hypothetical protein HDU93_006059 [Gonapodya sp. JEL0774]